MNKMQIALIVIPFTLVLGFQNCQKPAGVVDIEANNNFKPDPSLAVPVEVIPLKNETLKVIEFNQVQLSTNTINKANSDLNPFEVFQVNIETGYMKYISRRPGDIGAAVIYCLDDAGKQDLLRILNSDSICKLENRGADDQVCTQELDEGYATLITEREQFALGSANNGCRSKEVKLCNSDEDLQKWLVATKARLGSLGSCQ